MTSIKSLLQRLTPATAVSVLTAVLTLGAAVGAPVTKAQQASILVFGGALALLLFAHGLSNALKYLTPQTIVGLVTALIGVAAAFGLPITKAQSDSIINLTGLVAGLLLVHGIVHTVARDRLAPAATELTGLVLGSTRRFKGGRLPAVWPAGVESFLDYTTKLKAPPKAFKAVVKGVLPMDGNDRYSDCTMAGVAHLVAAFNWLFGKPDAVPTEGQIITEYFKETGGQDTGLVEANVLKKWLTKGLFGHKIAGYAPVKVTDMDAIRKAIAFYGGCYLGILCPESAQQQFAEHKPWTDEGEQTNDGHCIVAIGYDAHGNLECATWGSIVTVTPGFLKAYLEEAWVILSDELVKAGKDTLGLNVAALKADLAAA